ncbi:MAG: flagellar export chaperone FlgN [Planctomycetaceae bacterium]
MAMITSQEFLNAFRQRSACFRALLELSQLQAGLIADDNYSDLTAMLHHKQQLLDHLSDVTATQSAVWQAWPRERNGLSDGDRRACDAELAAAESLVSVLISAEKSCTDLLSQRKNATQRELQAVAQGIKAESAYGLLSSPPLSRLNLNT